MLTSRDQRIRRFIEAFGCATTKQIKEIFFNDVSLIRCQQRLKILYNGDKIDRDRIAVSLDYLYYIKKPREIEHMLIRVDAYIELTKLVVLNEFISEYQFNESTKDRADAYFEVWKDGIIIPYFLEVQRSSSFTNNQHKYENFYHSGAWRDKWDNFPAVIVLSDKNIRIKPTMIKYVIIDQLKKASL